MQILLKTAFPALCAFFLASCGGGGGNSPPPSAPSALSYPAPPAFNVGTAIPQLAPTVTGSVTSYTVAPALPTGLSFNAVTGIISGTPTAIIATANYVVTAANSSGNTTASLALTVRARLPVFTYGGTTFSYTTGVPVNLLAATGGVVDTWSIDRALPAGLAFSTTTGAITGTPTAVTPVANYIVTATNAGGNATVTLTLTVNAPTPVVTYGASSFTFTTGVAVNLVPSSGGVAATWSLDRTLPAGLALNGTTGVISGTPTQTAARAAYVVTAQNTGGADTDNLSIAVVAPTADNGVLLNLGHTSGSFPILHDGSRILSGDNASFALWNAQTGALIASTSVDCDPLAPCNSGEKMALHGPTAVIRRIEGLEVRSSVDGSVIASIAFPLSPNSWWKLATDGSYIAAGNATSLTVWSPTGAILFQRSGNQSAVKAFAATGELRLANEPNGNNVIEHVALPAGTSVTSPVFLGTFHSWFMDGESFFSNAGNSVWIYSHTATLRQLIALPSIAELGGQGDWAWTAATGPSVLRIYKIGAGTTPAGSYTLSNDRIIFPSTGTIGIAETTLNDSRQISVVDLSGASPVRSNYTSPLPRITGFGSASASDWAFVTSLGAMFGELGGPPPTRYSLGAARSIAGSNSRIAVATASGSIFYFNANTRQPQGEIEFTSGKIQLSADGTVLAASAESALAQYTPDNTLKVFSLPSETILADWPHSYPNDTLLDFTLSTSGTVIGQVTTVKDPSTGTFTSATNSVTLLDGTPIWSTVGPGTTSYGPIPIQLSPNGTLIALPDRETAHPGSGPYVEPASNIYLNGTLSTAASGYAVGWASDNRLLLNRYHGQAASVIYDGIDLVDASGQRVTGLLPIPELFEIQALSGNRIYSPERNEVFDLTTGARVWNSAEPHVGNAGAVAGANVVFTTRAIVKTEPL